jgi:acyl-CoA dehydrogenase
MISSASARSMTDALALRHLGDGDGDGRYSEIDAMAAFFRAKGPAAIKDEDAREQFYDDWLAYQKQHRLYGSVLSPLPSGEGWSTPDLLRLVRFVEHFAYYSPGHAYSLQVTFLSLFAILMGQNDGLKREAVDAIADGAVLGFGVSERDHGADLFGNEFRIDETAPGQYVANGSKYYIGNANVAAMIAVLARKGADPAGNARRAPFALAAVRPEGGSRLSRLEKIHTSGVRAAFVGGFSVKDYAFPASDLIAEGRAAWDAVFGSVTLGKFLLGFGSIGICSHALEEAVGHLNGRKLYGEPAMNLPHIRSLASRAYVRLAAMKLFAYRALDYLQAASETDRRYVLFNAVQKAKVGTEGEAVIALISECVGAKGFEGDTYIEMARRDAQLIPAVEGSTHVNQALAALFVPRYFSAGAPRIKQPKSLVAGEIKPSANLYLTRARAGLFHATAFAGCLRSYRPLAAITNVRLLAGQARVFAKFVSDPRGKDLLTVGTETSLMLGRFVATFAYAQLIAENCARCQVPPELISTIFDGLIDDLNRQALAMAAMPELDGAGRAMLRRMVTVPQTSRADWDFVAERLKPASG